MKKRWIYNQPLELVRPEGSYQAALCFCMMESMTDYEDIVKHLHPEERAYYHALKFEKRIKSYLMGRFVAKQAVAALIHEGNLADIWIQSGIFTQPVVVSNQPNIQVSVSHCADFGAALAFPEAHPMGIDIEEIYQDKREVLERQITGFEAEQLKSFSAAYDTGLMLLWTAKEALSKVLKTGLMTPFQIFEISKIEVCGDYFMSYYKNFAQYKVISFTMDGYMCSIVHPMKTKLSLDVESLRNQVAYI